MVFGLVSFFNEGLFCPVGFFVPIPRGSGSNLVDWVKLTPLAKLYRVGPKDTSFLKFNLISFIKYGLWILNLIQIFGLNLDLDPNIWIEFKS